MLCLTPCQASQPRTCTQHVSNPSCSLHNQPRMMEIRVHLRAMYVDRLLQSVGSSSCIILMQTFDKAPHVLVSICMAEQVASLLCMLFWKYFKEIQTFYLQKKMLPPLLSLCLEDIAVIGSISTFYTRDVVFSPISPLGGPVLSLYEFHLPSRGPILLGVCSFDFDSCQDCLVTLQGWKELSMFLLSSRRLHFILFNLQWR